MINKKNVKSLYPDSEVQPEGLEDLPHENGPVQVLSHVKA